MKPLQYLVIMICFIWSCKSTKDQVTESETDRLNTIIESKQFRIESDWAYPMVTNAMQQIGNAFLTQQGSTASSISLIGNSNFLEINKDSITSYLPYFGERQMNIGYGGNDTAIELSGTYKNFQQKENKNKGYDIYMEAKNKSQGELFEVNITIYPNLNTYITVRSGSRFPIRYSGVIVQD
ncbi:DUF4251 domain-containing protein [Cognatitamlana onchidii]|uniref:DUF4251 domain-containing protein n=1 Tax=Cognatitamlana onchidii TaxID=2562860 RepID=UPI0010A68AC9|nr:DUF4251 domain-containing protein [Algibacter onchidii]